MRLSETLANKAVGDLLSFLQSRKPATDWLNTFVTAGGDHLRCANIYKFKNKLLIIVAV